MKKSNWLTAPALFSTLPMFLSVVALAGDGCESLENETAFLKRNIAKLKDLVIKECNDPAVNLHKVWAGFKCRTSTGWVFERVNRKNFGEAWKGPDGLIWSDKVGDLTRRDAGLKCKSIGADLPSPTDSGVGEHFGFREVLPTMKHNWYWTTSRAPLEPGRFYTFYGNTSDLASADQYYVGAVRCVTR